MDSFSVPGIKDSTERQPVILTDLKKTRSKKKRVGCPENISLEETLVLIHHGFLNLGKICPPFSLFPNGMSLIKFDLEMQWF